MISVSYVSRSIKAILFSTGCLAFLYGWLATPQGTRLTVYGMCYFFSDRVKITGITGCLAGSFQIQQISYKDNAYQCTLSDLCVRFKTADLLRGKLTIKQLSLSYFDMIIQEKNYPIPSFVGSSWFGIEHLRIGNATIQMNDWMLQAKGAIGNNEVLIWGLTREKLAWNGEIRVDQTQEMRLKWGVRNESLAVSEPLSEEAISKEAKQSNCIRASTEKLPNYIRIERLMTLSSRFFKIFKTEWQLSAYLEDTNLLQYLGFVSEMPRNKSVTVNARLRSTLKQLTDYSQQSKFDAFKKHLGCLSFLPFELSVHAKECTFLSWSTFDNLFIKAKIYPGRVLWNGYLASKAIKQQMPKWQIIGDTRLSLNTPTLQFKSLADYLNMKTDLVVQGDSILFFPNTHYELKAAPKIKASIINHHIILSGKVDIPSACLQLDTFKPSIKPNSDIYFVSDDMHKSEWSWNVTLNFELGKRVYLHYAGLNARLAGSLFVQKQPKEPTTAQGEINAIEGGYSYFGQQLHLSSDSRLIFTKQFNNPQLDIAISNPIKIKLGQHLAENRSLSSSVGLHLCGSLQNPSMHLLLRPKDELIDSVDALSHLIIGKSKSILDGTATSFLMQAAAQLSKDYVNRYAAIDIDFDTRSLNTYLVLTKQLTPKLLVLWKAGLIESDCPIGFSYKVGKHTVIGASLKPNRTAAFEMAYQREWG